MWTPRRIGMLVLGFVLLLAAYILYAFTPIGGIDGLPALPEIYRNKVDGNNDDAAPRATNVNDMDKQLEVAFGKECPERDYAIKFQVRSKGMVLAAKEFVILKDGRVQLAPVSCAVFGKNNGDGRFPEINTIRGNIAWLTFDRPIVHPADMAKHKIVYGEVKGNVEIINNRRTPERDDDLTLFTQGPLFFKDDEHHIWTKVEVEIKDLQSKPDPTRVNAVGMDVWLATEATTSANTPPAAPKLGPPVAGKPGPKKNAPNKRPESITGVERVALRQDVEMHLFIDSNSGFLGNQPKDGEKKSKDKKGEAPAADSKAGAKVPPPNPPAAAPADGGAPPGQPPATQPPKSHVVIKTQGPFNYNVAGSHAQFDISEHPGPYPNRVSVNRFREEGKIDELDCERLEIQFSPKDAESPNATAHAVKDDRSLELEMENAHATGKDVMLKSDAEILEAYGDDFFYDRRTEQSILKGETEMWALKEGNEIHARELRLVNQKGAEQATAIGPGRIDMLDKATGKRPLHARWKDTLVYGKDGVYDLLVLTGDAAFLDDDHQQQLQADTLKVWLEPPDKDKDAKKESPPPDPGEKPASETAGTAQGRKPHHVEAISHVEAHSPDLNVHDSERLVIWFKDAAVGAEDLPALRPDAKKDDKPAAATEPNAPANPPADAAAPPPVPTPAGAATPAGVPTPVPAPMPEVAGPPGPTDNEPPLAKQPRPIDLTGRMVEAHVLRIGPRNELERLWTEGHVHVHQEPEKPDEKGVDITGETLQLTRRSQGNVLVVTDHHDLAKLRMDKIYIVGPVVHIDQTENKAWVNGAGLMIMDNNSTFSGGKLNKTVPLEIHWNKTMYFDGQWAEFHGGVQAEQENSTLLCQSMQVFLDRAVSLKGEDKGAPPAKVRKLACDQKVEVEDREFDTNNKLLKYQRLECPELSVDNEESVVLAAGPGVVRILQRGSEEPQLTPGPDQGNKTTRPAAGSSKKADDSEMKLTRVRYQGRMYANNKNHTAIFTDNVEVFNVPSDNPNMELEREKLPENGLWVHSDKLEVYSRQQEDGKSNQEMRASGHVSFRTPDSMGSSAVITYHSEKEQVILEGGESGIATLYQEKVKGGPRKTMKAEKIIYLRTTGEFTGNRIKEVTGN